MSKAILYDTKATSSKRFLEDADIADHHETNGGRRSDKRLKSTIRLQGITINEEGKQDDQKLDECISDPVITKDTVIVAPKGGFPRFVQTSKFHLFGIKEIPVTLYNIHPEDGYLYELWFEQPALFQAVQSEKKLCLGRMVGYLEGTPIGAIELGNVNIVRQNVPIDTSCPLGLTIKGSISVGPSHAELHTLLSDLLGVKQPRLDLLCNLPSLSSWKEPLSPSTFSFSAALPDIKAKVIPSITITSIGLTVHSYPGFILDRKTKKLVPKRLFTYMAAGTLSLDWSFGGALSNPIQTSYILQKNQSQYRLSATSHIDWENAFGVKGLTLRNVGFNGQLSTEIGWKFVILGLGCELSIADTTVNVYGNFSFDGYFSINFEMENLTWETIRAIHKHFNPDASSLEIPDMALKVERVAISVSKEPRSWPSITFEMINLKFGDYPGSSAILALGPEGGKLDVEVKDGELTIREVTISEAHLILEIKCDDSSFQKVITGQKRGAGKRALVKANKVQTVWGNLDTVEGGFNLGKHIPGLENSVLSDIVIHSARIVVASRYDDHSILKLAEGQTLVEGIQVLIDIGECNSLRKVLKSETLGISLFLAWRWDAPGNIIASIQTRNLTPIKLGDNFRTGDLALKLMVGTAALTLQFEASAWWKPQDNEKELQLTLIAGITMEGLKIGGTLLGYWNNPFGLCERLILGPNLTLILVISFAGGLPTDFTFLGGAMIGETKGHLVIRADVDPRKNVYSVQCSDLVLSQALQLMVPPESDLAKNMPDDIFTFNQVHLYVCPFGTIIEETVYKQGFTFSCDALIWGKKGRVCVEISTSAFCVEGEFEKFNIGPYEISGTQGPNIKFGLAITQENQIGYIDGRIIGPGAL
ncbi:uncharacterized protein L201_007232 [Kwoniella dendrophila CBS 6074]|uniref:Uncharacterized protein n=1 Tax=Kwoniella dendrophila CBS 6074 TaxID=1295534 RepID=A0AAX4K696_9TREE